MFTFTISNIKQLSVCQVTLKVLRSWADLQLYDTEFQAEGALTLNAFADSASAIRACQDLADVCVCEEEEEEEEE